MACSKYILTNTGSTLVNFSYRRCDDSLWDYQVELLPNQTKNIWVIDGTYTVAPSFKGGILLINEGSFPPISATSTPTPSPTNTPSQTATPTNTATNTPTPSVTTTQTSTPTSTPTPTNTETPTQTPTTTTTLTSTPTPTQTETQTPTPTNTTTPTPTPTSPLQSFSVYSAITSNEACDNGVSVTIYAFDPLFDQNTHDACLAFSASPQTIYGSIAGGVGPNVGEFLYEATARPLTDVVPNGFYSNGTAWYQVTGGLGQITSSDPNGCL
jgi:hypothetical protein